MMREMVTACDVVIVVLIKAATVGVTWVHACRCVDTYPHP